MNKTLLGFLIGFALPFVAGFLFVELGGMPVATSGRPLPLEKWIAHVSIHRAMGSEVDNPSPIAADAANLNEGARIYRAQCAVCHGTPGSLPTPIAQGLFPEAPQLVSQGAKGVTDDSVGETYWKAKNGIRLTGMPGFSRSLSDRELWQVSLLLQKAHSLPPGVLENLKSVGK